MICACTARYWKLSPGSQPLPVYSLDATAEAFPFSYTAQENTRAH
jgi:hypothetical protein